MDQPAHDKRNSKKNDTKRFKKEQQQQKPDNKKRLIRLAKIQKFENTLQ